MAQRPATHFGGDFAPRGLSLAERRLAYLAELYETGRWRRFHGDADFLVMVREAKAAVDTWRRLLRPDPIEIERAPSAPLAVAGGAALTAAALVGGDDAGWGGLPLPDAEPPLWLRRHQRLPPVEFSAHGVLAEHDLAEA